MAIDVSLIVLILLFIILGTMSRGKRMYKISWLDSEGNRHELTRLCQHKKDVILSALNDAAGYGKISYMTIICVRDRDSER